MAQTPNGNSFSGSTWDSVPNFTPKNNFNEKSVQSALYCIQVARDTKVTRDSKNFLIQSLFEQGFEIRSPLTPARINSKLIQQVFWRTANRMKPLDFEVFGSGRPDINRRLVTAGVRTVMSKGGYERALRDKGGAYQKALMWGDGFVHFGANPDPEADFPIVFTPISNSNIYTDSYSTSIRAGGVGRSTRKMAIIFSMPWSQFIERYPKGKKIAAIGKVPRDTGFYKELERTFIQTNKEYDMIEVCYFYDLDNEGYVVFAGPTCAIIEEHKGEKYPFRMHGQPYIPVLQYICMPSSEGFYNHGLGDMFFDVAMLASQLMNMGYNHAADNIDPFTIIGLPKGETAKLFNSMRAAGEMRASGKRPIIPVEYDPDRAASNQVRMEALVTQNMAQELDAMINYLTREVARMGINIDDVEYGPTVTAHQIVAEQQSQNNFVAQIQEYNASEEQFAVEATLDMIEKLVGKKNKTPLNLVGKFKVESENGEEPMQIKGDQFTLGMVADELKKHYYWVDVNARTGAQPSGILEQARIEKIIGMTQPGTKAQNKLLNALAKTSSLDLEEADFMPLQPEVPAGPEGQTAPEGGGSSPMSLPTLPKTAVPA